MKKPEKLSKDEAHGVEFTMKIKEKTHILTVTALDEKTAEFALAEMEGDKQKSSLAIKVKAAELETFKQMLAVYRAFIE